MGSMLKNLLLALTDCVLAYHTGKNEYVFIGDSFEKIFLTEPSALQTNPQLLLKLVHHNDVDIFTKTGSPHRVNESVELKYRIVVKGGIKWLAEKKTLIRDDETGHDILLSIIKELTEYTLIECVTDSICILGADLRLKMVNTAFEKNIHLGLNDAVGNTMTDIFPDSKNTKFEKACLAALSSQECQLVVEYSQRLSTWFEIGIYPYETGLLLLLKNITKQKTLNDKTLLVKNNLESLINNTDDLIWSVDKNMNIISMNTAFKKTIEDHAKRKPTEGESALMAGYTDGMLQNWKSYYLRALNGESYIIPQKPYSRGAGVEGIYEISFNPIFNKKKEVIGAGCFARDITYRLKAEASLNEQNKKLRSIASLSSHELRGPVASILGLTSIFDHVNIDKSENLQIIQHIRMASEELDRVIRDIVVKAFVADSE